MSRDRVPSRLLAALALALSAAAHADVSNVFVDAGGDAVLRRTDPGSTGAVPAPTLPDLLSVTLRGWSITSGAPDPFVGQSVEGDGAPLVRIDAVFAGLVNPPGPIGVGGQSWDPFRFGPSPVYGFLDFDIDRERDTGGELPGPAANRFLANVARFGSLPSSSIAERAARSSEDIDFDFDTGPQYERTGADFALVMCGCFAVTLVSETGDGDGVLESGESMLVRGRFFQRAAGYQAASVVFGGSAPGLYDPLVNLRFSHDPVGNTTTASLVFALRPSGAAALAGAAVQPVDSSVSNHVSVQEAVLDLGAAANGQHGSIQEPAWTLVEGWDTDSMGDILDPTRWRSTALIGTAYAADVPALYAWTDIGYECTANDLDGDGLVNGADLAAFDAALSSADGGPTDGDGVANGSFQIIDFGLGFSLYDLNADGSVNAQDRARLLPPCAADFNASGLVTVQDLYDFFEAWLMVQMTADINGNGSVTVQDVYDFLTIWMTGCP